jgi:hypothetical protein
VLVGPSLAGSPFATTYVSSYSPPFDYVPHASTATQTLPLDAGKGPGIWLGVERALGSHIGLQLSAHYGEADLSGAAGQYDLTMRYTSRPPPSYEPVEVTVHRSEAQAAAEGRLKTLAVALDLVAWADLGSADARRVRGRVAAHRRGSEPRLLGLLPAATRRRSTRTTRLVRFPASTLGIDAGGFAEVDLGRRAGLRLDVGYCWGPEQDAEVTLREVVSADPAVRSTPLDEIERGLAAVPVRLNPSSFRAVLALTLRF